MGVQSSSVPGPLAAEESPAESPAGRRGASPGAALLAQLGWPQRMAARLVRGLAAGRAGHRALSLALQGGGAHGAFTWGVLDRLVEDERLAIDAVSGASAGAMNAVVLAAGWLEGGRDGARAALGAFWRRIADVALLSPLNPAFLERLCGPFKPDLSMGHVALGMMTRLVSPYQFNPLQLNPLRTILADSIDFERLRRDDGAGPELLIAATGLRDGRCRVFRRREVSADVVLASACLPNLHHAVEIDGEPYWDGGFSSNPPLLALAEREAGAGDILLVQINPAGAEDLPVTAPGIVARLNELTFNGPLRAELDALALGARLAREGFRAGGALGRRLARLRLHRIDGVETLRPLAAATKVHPDWRTLTYLRDQGREAAGRWLADHFDALGRRPTFDLVPAGAVGSRTS